jgi:hypothetical protein
MGVDHVVADLEVDALDLANELELLDVIDGVGDGVLLWSYRSGCRTKQRLMSASNGPRG